MIVFQYDPTGLCGWDWVTVVDADGSTLLEKKCGFKSPFIVTSKSNRLWIHFRTDNINEPFLKNPFPYTGFSATWISLESLDTSGMFVIDIFNLAKVQ